MHDNLRAPYKSTSPNNKYLGWRMRGKAFEKGKATNFNADRAETGGGMEKRGLVKWFKEKKNIFIFAEPNKAQ
ncbi:hypothetical protein [Intestinibacillus massiliensis]